MAETHPVFLAEFQIALPVGDGLHNETRRVKAFVNCGEPMPGYEIQIRDSSGLELPERNVGTLFVRGPSVMTGYFEDAGATHDVLSPDGWFNTGDLAYRIGCSLFITGREKDMIIINGRNIWPQDLEYVAEHQPEVRSGNASAFSVPGPDGRDQAVLVIQGREQDEAKSADLKKRVRKLVRKELGIDCFIELVPRHTLPRTTSGKLSRSKARKDFLKRKAASQMPPVEMTRTHAKEARLAV